jgi:hypothetical protein
MRYRKLSFGPVLASLIQDSLLIGLCSKAIEPPLNRLSLPTMDYTLPLMPVKCLGSARSITQSCPLSFTGSRNQLIFLAPRCLYYSVSLKYIRINRIGVLCLLSIDGSTAKIPKTPEAENHFGVWNQPFQCGTR